jgi:hypothetical protein
MPNRDRITVQGTARRRVSPDIAIWSAAVDSRATTQGAAFTACSSDLAALLKQVKAAAGDDTAIWASGVYVSREWDDRGQRKAGYAASGSVSIRSGLAESARLGQVALDAGATRLDGPTFEVSNLDEVLDDLRSDAVLAARETADRMALAAGRALGQAILVSDGPIGDVAASAAGGRMSRMMAAAEMGADAPPVEPGPHEVSASVTVTYVLVDAPPRRRSRSTAKAAPVETTATE